MNFQTRREFLATGLKGASLLAASRFVPAFLARTAAAVGAERGAPILVVVQLSGGNDGLNTLVPHADDHYYKARPTIALKSSELLKLDAHLGLHPELKPLKNEYDEGRFSIIGNVGYPNPNRSHFRSMEIWHTGMSDRPEATGWLGRYFDAQCNGADPHPGDAEIGVSFGKVMPQAFRNRANVGLAIDNPETFQWNASGETIALAKAQEAIFARLNRPAGAGAMRPMSMETLGGISGSEPETADFLRHTAMNAMVAGDSIRALLGKGRSRAAYPQSRLGQELSGIAKLIAGNFPARVYYASQGGFDTHANQLANHARLLGDVAASLDAFLTDLRAHKEAERVMVLAFSEFGRRVAENGSGGTDHGAAAPIFLLGPRLKGGLHGGVPDLAHLQDGDLKHRIDFRQVYAAILSGWLGADSARVLLGQYEPAPILA